MSRRINLNPTASSNMIPVEKIQPTMEVPTEEVFNPEAGKMTDEPFVEELASDGYEDLTVAELKEALKEKGLSITGNKADLIARLRAPVSDSTEAPTDSTVAVEEEETGLAEATPVEQTKEGEVSESEESGGKEPIVE